VAKKTNLRELAEEFLRHAGQGCCGPMEDEALLAREYLATLDVAEALAEALDWIEVAVLSGRPYSQVQWKVRAALASYRGEK